MYKIGDFSKLVGTSIRTLRYYDEIDLFTPEVVNVDSGYRYYSKNQTEDFKIIIELKESGFSLEEIKNNWNNFDEDILLDKKKELYLLQTDIKEQIRRIDHLRNRIRNGRIVSKEIKEDKIIRR